jgi:hypothetical protein
MQMSMDRLRGDGGWRAPNVAGRRGPVTARDGGSSPILAPGSGDSKIWNKRRENENRPNESVGSAVRRPD